MPRRPTVIRIKHERLVAEEAFLSKLDAEAWREMIEATLEHAELVPFDLAVFAEGLAQQVRLNGGGYVRNALASGYATAEGLAKGDPVSGYETVMRIKATLAGPSK
jgi:hypothetical protein